MAVADLDLDVNRARPMTREEKKVFLATSAGTIFEWYDFYLYGPLAAVIGALLVPGGTHRRSIFEDDPDHKVHH
ncbi:MAG: hypothetical protein ACKVPY_18000 [Paracoccaceae bacterium]